MIAFFSCVRSNYFPAIFLWSVAFSQAVGLTVKNLEDGAADSLRQIIAQAESGDVVDFDSSLSGETINLSLGEIVFDKNIEINASALSSPIVINGMEQSRLFSVVAGSSLTLSSVVLSDGLSDNGGAIYNSGTLCLERVTLLDNTASRDGGAIYNFGTLKIVDCTFEGNRANRDGGGIYVRGSTSLTQSLFVDNSAGEDGGGLYGRRDMTIFNCTFTENEAEELGGAIRNVKDLTLHYCTITGNEARLGGGIYASNESPRIYNCIAAGNGEMNLDGRTTFGENSLTESVPSLLPLGNYGGFTRTMPPEAGSGAIDMGTATANTEFDQRGMASPRLFGEATDIGAVEFQGDDREAEILFTTDTDGDGMINGLEEALGRNPNEADPLSNRNPRIVLSNGQPVMLFGYNASTHDRTILEFFSSKDLQNYEETPAFTNEADRFMAPVNGGLYDFRLNDPPPEGGRIFYRVEARLRPTPEPDPPAMEDPLAQ